MTESEIYSMERHYMIVQIKIKIKNQELQHHGLRYPLFHRYSINFKNLIERTSKSSHITVLIN